MQRCSPGSVISVRAAVVSAAPVVSVILPVLSPQAVTDALDIPTVGIGSGKFCSGQVQVITDLLGLMEFKPKHAKRYVEAGEIITGALKNYADDVKNGAFPTEENSFQ